VKIVGVKERNNMKRIIILLLHCLYFQSIFSSEKEYELVPAHQGLVEITSCDGLRQLAVDKQEDWDTLSQQYSIAPSALAEYMCNGTITNSYTDQETLCRIAYQKYAAPHVYNNLTKQIITEIRDSNKKNESILQSLQQKYHDDLKQNILKEQQQIDAILPDYNKKKPRFLCRTACATAVTLAFFGGWTAVGVFAWVWDHCHHPWD